MQNITKLLLMLTLIVGLCQAEIFNAQPTQNNVGVYKNQMRGKDEKAFKKIDKNETVVVTKTSGGKYFVKLDDGSEGWVEKRFLMKAKGKAYTFDAATVQGYMDSPTPFYITDADRGISSPIDIEKSFLDNITQNADKEIVLRNNHE